jgi:hypothetical protein
MAERVVMLARAIVEWVRTKLPPAAPAANPTARQQPLHGRRGYGDGNIKLPK